MMNLGKYTLGVAIAFLLCSCSQKAQEQHLQFYGAPLGTSFSELMQNLSAVDSIHLTDTLLFPEKGYFTIQSPAGTKEYTADIRDNKVYCITCVVPHDYKFKEEIHPYGSLTLYVDSAHLDSCILVWMDSTVTK